MFKINLCFKGITEDTKESFLKTFYNKTLVSQCILPNGNTNYNNESECLKYGYCKIDSKDINYFVTTQSECQSQNFGICEVCDEKQNCFKLPIGDYCKINDPSINNFEVCENYGFYWSEILGTCIIPHMNQSECTCVSGSNNYPACLNGTNKLRKIYFY